MEWLFCINPNVAIGLACALGCAACLRVCADEVKTMLAWRRANMPARPLVPRDRRYNAPARSFAPAYAHHAPRL